VFVAQSHPLRRAMRVRVCGPVTSTTTGHASACLWSSLIQYDRPCEYVFVVQSHPVRQAIPVRVCGPVSSATTGHPSTCLWSSPIQCDGPSECVLVVQSHPVRQAMRVRVCGLVQSHPVQDDLLHPGMGCCVRLIVSGGVRWLVGWRAIWVQAFWPL
jgi:hypothetical protein